jgi:hypothetical protein
MTAASRGRHCFSLRRARRRVDFVEYDVSAYLAK